MKVCLLPLLLVQIVLIIPLNGASADDLQHKGRRWSSGGDGPYSLVVSADESTAELDPQETVGYALALQEKKSGKIKNGDETTGKTMDKYDKATERLTMKETRKRLIVNSETNSSRKRRRHPTVGSTTGLPQTMSYNLYNHFRPLEQDVPQDHILPFLDFGRKLSTGGYNSIESSSSSTQRTSSSSSSSTTRLPPFEDVYHDEMDVTVVKSTVERNFPPRRPSERRNVTDFFADKIHDLQPNESGRKIQIVLSPNYGLRLNKTSTEERNTTMTTTTTEKMTTPTEKTTTEKTMTSTEKTVTLEDDAVKIEDAQSSQLTSQSEPLEPSPTARILSTAVVTSVSVKESPRFPRIRANNSEVNHRINPMKSDIHGHHSSPVINDHNRSAVWHNSSRRKFTTFRPKTTTFRPVTFRSAFRRNSSHMPVVVHVASTPPSYIEVPRISPVSRVRTTFQPVESTSDTVEHTLSTSSTTLASNVSIVDTVPEYTTVPTQPTTSTEHTSTSSAKPEVTTPVPRTELQEFNTVLPTNPPTPAVEIEFRPLANSVTQQTQPPTTTKPSSTTTTTRPYNFTIPLIPDLLWVYGQRNNHSVKTQPSTVDLAFHETTWGIATYVLVALGMVPLLLGAVVLVRHILLHSKKKVLDESEYSSEYNRSPLPTKLPRLPAHIQSWEETKPSPPSPLIPPSVGTKWEFPRDKLRLQTVLGQGNFGQVWKAEADDISGHEGLTRLVAVKTVKEGSSLREKEDLLRELAIMQELGAHPNVVTLLGCCAEKEPYLLIMEYVMYGKLLAFLREHRTRAHYFNFSDLSSALNSRDLTVFSYCVARGMEYLVSKGIIHRDLAARNILVDHNKLCKIADFGMSRNVRDTGEIYEQRPNRGALPIRWMAPESLHYNLFTHKSDVWSFGVLLWEIVTLGSTPYNTMGAREVMRQVVDGYRLEKPKHCKAEFFKVLSKCWNYDPNKRPSFSELKAEIGNLLGTSDTEGRFVNLEAMAEEIIDQGH